MKEHRNSLRPGYKLHWYTIHEVLGQGGFGITYLAHDTNLDQPVAIKEYLPLEMAVREDNSSVHPVSGERGEQFRWGLDRFISEAQTLAQFKHPNIVRVFTVFTENNTAYMIMEYERGQGLHEILKQRSTLPETELTQVLMPILDGLELVHDRGFIHRDIKPANIFVRSDGSPVLLDFGSARQSLGEATHTLTTLVSPGFAPFEQYTGKSDKQGPWTDIYGLGATFYRSVTGRAPADAMNRSEALLQTSRDVYVRALDLGPPGYSKRLLSAIDRALAFRFEDRPQTIREWRDDLHGRAVGAMAAETATAERSDVLPLPVAAPSNQEIVKITMDADAVSETARAPERPSRRGLIAAALIVLVLVVALGIIGKRHATLESPAPKPITLPSPTQPDTGAAVPAPSGGVVPDGSRATPQASESISGTPPTDTQAVPTQTQPTAQPTSGKQPISQVTPQSIQSESDAAAGNSALIGPREREQLGAIRRRLRQNPGDREARQRLRALSTEFELAVKQAVKNKDYDRAEAYINEMLQLTPDNERLKDARQAIARARRDAP